VSAGRGALAGRFEHDRVDAIMRMVQPGDCVWDVGAHKGYITLACAGRVGDAGHVHAFEAGPPNLDFLRRHIAWNHVGNVTVLPCAVGREDGAARFGGSGSSIAYRLGTGDYEVRVRSIRSLVAEGLRPPAVVKIDVEGSEADVLRGGIEALPADTLMFIAIHSHEQYAQCAAILHGAGWSIGQSRGIVRNLQQAQWQGDPDIIAAGPERQIDRTALPDFTFEERVP
jgi:FkbM family methyltransferase